MRFTSILFLSFFCVACDSGRTHMSSDAGHVGTDLGPAHDGGPNDAGPVADGGAHDGGPLDAAMIDAAMIDAAAHDGGPATDGGPRVDAGGADAGTGTDGGTHVPGESCAMPIDVSVTGTTMIDTCMFADHVAATCASAAGPDVVIRGDAPMSGSTYSITVDAGWVIEQTDGSCTPMLASCGTPTWGVSGATPAGHWWWAIQKADGSCGVVNIMVTRSM